MIDHIGINVSDLLASKLFYGKVLAPLGYGLIVDKLGSVSFGVAGGCGDPGGFLWLSKGEPMTPRMHFAFGAATHEQVTAFFTAGVAAGGKSNGAPMMRPQYHKSYFAAYLIDPDGYNIEAVCHLL